MYLPGWASNVNILCDVPPIARFLERLSTFSRLILLGRSGEEYLLARSLFRRLGTGEPADTRFLAFIPPHRWFYDVLRALDHFREAGILTGTAPDPRCEAAIGHVRSKRRDDGTWALDWSPTGRVWFEIDAGEDQPSRWVTLKAPRVLDWWERH